MELTLPLFLITVVAILAAWRGLRAIPQSRHGRWSYIALFGGLFYGFIAYGSAIGPSGHSRESSKWGACMSNLKQHSLALIMYSSDNNNRLPETKWWSKSEPYVGHDLGACPSSRQKYRAGTAKFDYAMNVAVPGTDPAKWDSRTMLLGEVRPGLPEAVVSNERDLRVRHKWRINFARVDGSVVALTTSSPAERVIWEPRRAVDVKQMIIEADPDRFRSFRLQVERVHATLVLFASPVAFVGAIIGTYRAPRHRREFWRQVFVGLLIQVVLACIFLPVFW